MDQEKITIALLGVLVGFITNKVYDIVMVKLNRHHIHFNMVQELSFIREYLKNLKLVYEKKIEGKDSLHGGTYPRKMVAPINEKYYADICLYLNYSQRSSFQQIYIIIEELNDFISKFFFEKCTDKQCKETCMLDLVSSYRSVCDVLFFVDNHIAYEKQPIERTQVLSELEDDRKEVDLYLKKLGY